MYCVQRGLETSEAILSAVAASHCAVRRYGSQLCYPGDEYETSYELEILYAFCLIKLLSSWLSAEPDQKNYEPDVEHPVSRKDAKISPSVIFCPWNRVVIVSAG